jgi:hypothetical protein
VTAEADHPREASQAEAETAPLGERGILVYGVVDAEAPMPKDLVGLDKAPVTTVRHGQVAAVVGEIALDRPPGRRADLVAYSDVLDTLAREGTVAPVQFGSVLADERAVLDDLLAPYEGEFAQLLSELTGRKQFNLRASYVEDVVLAELVASDPEIRELRELTKDLPEEAAYGERVRLGELVARSLEDRSAYDADALLDATVPLVAAHVIRAGAGLDHVLDVAVLVDEDRIDEFVDRLEGLAEAVHERIQLRLVGPVAPYDFVGGA